MAYLTELKGCGISRGRGCQIVLHPVPTLAVEMPAPQVCSHQELKDTTQIRSNSIPATKYEFACTKRSLPLLQNGL
jgi:hypothetical protein